MTDSFVTQCPHCQTSFRVSHAQLSVARGVVRCGSCLQVFNAAKQLLEQRAGNQAKAPESTATAVPVQPPVVEIPSAPAIPVLPPVIAPPVVASPASGTWKDQPLNLDTLDLDNLDLDEELARLEQREIQLPESFGREHHVPDIESNLSARRDEPETGREPWLDSLRNDDVNDLPELHGEVIQEPEEEPEPEPEISERHSRTEPSLSLDHDVLDDDEPVRVEPRIKRSRGEPAVRDQALLDLTDDPLQLDWQKPKPRWGRRLGWLFLILLAIAALAGQYIWYHFDELARQDQYRPWFEELCPQIGCKVPSKVDIKLLKSSNLVVRSHPDFQGALVVDAIIYNRASFSQPFPLLELRFADPNGQLIASRRFKPGEYLSGEMAGKAEMPPQTPIHIALDILDPGPKAVNYSLSFRSPE